MALSSRMTRLVRNIKIHLPGLVDDALKLEMFNALDDFFKGSSVWQDSINVNIVTPSTTYEISPTDDGQIDKLVSVVDANDFPIGATMATPGVLELDLEPTTSQVYTTTVSLTVVDPVDTNGYPVCPDWVIDKYGNGLISGVVGRLMLQPAKPYSNERMSIFHNRTFRGTIAQAKVDGRHSNLYRGQNWAFPGGWGTRKAGR